MITAVVLIPGITGSHLYLPDPRGNSSAVKIWLNLEDPVSMQTWLATGVDVRFFGVFVDPSMFLYPAGLVDFGVDIGIAKLKHVYMDTKGFFKRNGFAILIRQHNWSPDSGDPTDKLFFEFPYDWRQHLGKIADELDKFINKVVLGYGKDTDIFLVAHSAGGLISREYLRKHKIPNIKKQILLGPTNHGAPKAFLTLRWGISGALGFLIEPKTFGDYGLFLQEPPWSGQELLSYFLPSPYFMLPDERYEQYFKDYGPIVTVGLHEERTIRGTYLAKESTLFDEQYALKYYALKNEKFVKDALDFSKTLGRDSFLPGQTFVFYASDRLTQVGIDNSFSRPGHSGLVRWLKVGDGTVPARSAYDLDGVVDNEGKPIPMYAIRCGDPSTGLPSVDHVGLATNEKILEKVLEIILSP